MTTKGNGQQSTIADKINDHKREGAYLWKPREQVNTCRFNNEIAKNNSF
jgi:hypothetical protein